MLKSTISNEVINTGKMVQQYFKDAEAMLSRLNQNPNLSSVGRAQELKNFHTAQSNAILEKLHTLKKMYLEFEKQTEQRKEKESLAWKPSTQTDELVFHARKNDYAKKIALFRTAADFFNEYDKRVELEEWETVRMFETEAVGLLAKLDQLKSIELQETIRRTQEKRITQTTKEDVQYLKESIPFRNTLNRLITEGEITNFKFFQPSTLYSLMAFAGLDKDVISIGSVTQMGRMLKTD